MDLSRYCTASNINVTPACTESSRFSDSCHSAPSVPNRVVSLPSTSNLLHVSVEELEDSDPQHPFHHILCATTADRRLHLLSPDGTFSLLSTSHIQDSPILSCVLYGKKYLTTLTSGMSGQLVLYDHKEDRLLDERRDHTKYVVKIATCEENASTTWVASAGWDNKIFLYQMVKEGRLRLTEPIAQTATETSPESITFIKHPDLDRPVLLITRRDSTFLHYYRLPAINRHNTRTSIEMSELYLLGSQNLAPHSNAWIAFSPSSVAICPKDPTLLAVALSATPYMSRANSLQFCSHTIHFLFPAATNWIR